jgi:hypothetical protein
MGNEVLIVDDDVPDLDAEAKDRSAGHSLRITYCTSLE